MNGNGADSLNSQHKINSENKMSKPPDRIIDSGNTSDNSTNSTNSTNSATPNRFSFSAFGASFNGEDEKNNEENEENDENSDGDEMMVFENSFEEEKDEEPKIQQILKPEQTKEKQSDTKNYSQNQRFSGILETPPGFSTSFWKAGISLSSSISNVINTSTTSTQPKNNNVRHNTKTVLKFDPEDNCEKHNFADDDEEEDEDANEDVDFDEKLDNKAEIGEEVMDDLDEEEDLEDDDLDDLEDDDDTLIGDLTNLKFSNENGEKTGDNGQNYTQDAKEQQQILDDYDEEDDEDLDDHSPFSANRGISECPFVKFINDSESPGSVHRQQACRSLLRALEIILQEITKVTIEHNIKRSKQRFLQYCTAVINLTSKDQEPMVRAEAVQKVPLVLQTVYWELQRASSGTLWLINSKEDICEGEMVCFQNLL